MPLFLIGFANTGLGNAFEEGVALVRDENVDAAKAKLLAHFADREQPVGDEEEDEMFEDSEPVTYYIDDDACAEVSDSGGDGVLAITAW